MSNKRWYAVIYGAVINLFAFAAATSCLPVLFSEISEDLGLSVLQVGIVWGAGSVAGIFSIIIAGSLTDRYGAKRVLTIVGLMAGVFGILRGISDSFLTLTLTNALFGLAAEAIPVIVVKNASQWFYGEKRFATIQSIITAGVGAGMMLGAMLSATVLSPRLGGWQNVMFFYGSVSAVMALVWLFTVPEPPRREALAAGTTLTPLQAVRHVLSNRNMWLIATAMMCFAGGSKGFVGYLPLYLRNAGWPAAAADGTLAAFNAASTVVAIPLALLSDKLGLRKSLLLPGLFITFISMALLPAFAGPPVWILAVFSGIFRETTWAIAATMIVETEGIGAEYAGTAVGMEHAFTRVGYTFAPPAGNAFVPLGAGLPFVFWAGLSFIALAGFIFTKETGPRKLKQGLL